jgi:hypothetical protein
MGGTWAAVRCVRYVLIAWILLVDCHRTQRREVEVRCLPGDVVPPPRIASSSRLARAKAIARARSALSLTRTMTDGWASIIAFQIGRASS